MLTPGGVEVKVCVRVMIMVCVQVVCCVSSSPLPFKNVTDGTTPDEWAHCVYVCVCVCMCSLFGVFRPRYPTLNLSTDP